MHHALSPTPADETDIALAKIQFEQQSPAGLIAWYNKQQKLGMVGVHRQVFHCIALHEVFQERFGYSPFVVEGRLVVGFGPPLALTPGGMEAVVLAGALRASICLANNPLLLRTFHITRTTYENIALPVVVCRDSPGIRAGFRPNHTRLP